MKNNYLTKFILLLLICVGNFSFAQIIYKHIFDSGITATSSYTVAPATIDANLNSSLWSTAPTTFTSFAGASGTALSLNNSGGSPTYSLTYNVASGFNCDITAFSFWRQRSTSGAQNWTLTVNGITTLGTGTVPTTGTDTGSLTVSNAANGLSGTVNVVLQLGGASGTGTFRLDDFTLYGTVYSTVTCTPPTLQASSFASSGINTNSATVNWTSGNGGNVIVLARQSSAVNASPSNGVVYTANSVFGSGQQIGSGNYVVFNGTGTSVNVTGLASGTDYYFSLFEFDGSTNCYLTPALTGSLTTVGVITSTACLQIKSILVDACQSSSTNYESYNEMVYFKNGPNPLPIDKLSLAGAPSNGVYALNKWPNNNNLWNGVVQNTLTASNVSTINGSIINCGYVLEPPQTAGIGIIPASANVILVGSQDMNPLSNSFANLTDTIYMIFQAVSTTTNGNFANWSSTVSGGRSLVLIDNLNGCTSNSVTYEPALLSNHTDGDGVLFDVFNNPTYYNSGCQAPYSPLSVNAGPDQTICFNSQAVFTATPSGTYNSLVWSGGAGVFSSLSSLTTTYTPGFNESVPVKLYCTITRSCSTSSASTKDSVLLMILQKPQGTLISSKGDSLCPGETTIMSYSITNAAVADVVTPSWSSPSGSGTTYTISAPTGTASVIYSLNLTNVCGTWPNIFTIYPLALPTVTLSATTPTACVGSTLSLSASGNTSNFSWNNPVSTSSVVTITASTTTTGIVTSTNSCGSASDTYTLTVTQNPTISVDNANVNLCLGQSATVTATSSSGTYSWTPDAVNTNTIVVNAAGTHTVTTYNICNTASTTVNVIVSTAATLSISSTSNSVCTGGQVTSTLSLSGSTGSYTWSTGGTGSSEVISAPGIYTATVTTSTCGSANSSFTVEAIANPTITLSTSAFTACPGDLINVIATSSEGNYAWSGSANTTATLAITASSSTTGVVSTTNICNINATDTYTINVISPPTLTVNTTSPIVLCNGQSTIVTASSSVNNYTWMPGGITTNTYAINSTGDYTVYTSNGCIQDSAIINVTLGASPSLTLTASSNTICPNETATLSVTGGTSPYVWSNSSSTGSVVISTGGTVAVTNTNVCGTDTQTINVVVNSVNASISGDPTSGTLPVVVSFTNNSIGINSYAWNFGNGNSASTQTVTSQTYSAAGTYTVYLTATNGSCSDTDFLVITVINEEPFLIIPNVFTPNNDSVNDIFRITGFNIVDFNCVVFDRWGLQMFSWSDIKKGWDGKIDGKEATDGTYFYIINAKDIDGKEIKKQGALSLFK